jgi:DNA-binding NarL/FixJ family response regulator
VKPSQAGSGVGFVLANLHPLIFMTRICILLVDDSPEFLQSAERFLAADPDIEVVGCARSGREAIAQVTQLHPDLVLMDLGMPGMNGLEATCRIRARSDAPRVVILTLHDNAEYRVAALAAGAEGYVTKSEFGTALLPFIHVLFDDAVSGVGCARQIQSR